MPLTAEDRVAMIELVSRYNHAVDGRDAQSWADTFTQDGVFRMQGRDEIRGRAALVAMVESLGAPGARHWTTNFVIDGDGDYADMQVDLVVVRGSRVLATGRYDNTMQRVDGEWRFARRDYFPDAQ